MKELISRLDNNNKNENIVSSSLNKTPEKSKKSSTFSSPLKENEKINLNWNTSDKDSFSIK